MDPGTDTDADTQLYCDKHKLLTSFELVVDNIMVTVYKYCSADVCRVSIVDYAMKYYHKYCLINILFTNVQLLVPAWEYNMQKVACTLTQCDI